LLFFRAEQGFRAQIDKQAFFADSQRKRVVGNMPTVFFQGMSDGIVIEVEAGHFCIKFMVVLNR
jgi:hypothetical protein